MADQARITSVEALDEFRASLIVYLSKARPALEEVSSDVLRVRTWLEHEQRTHWENQLRRRTRALEQAQQALFGARVSTLREATEAENAAVQRARRAVEEAEAKLKRVRHWSRDFDSHVEPMAKQLDQLRNLLAIDLPRAVAHLAEVIKTLSDYAGMTLSVDGGGAGAPRATEAPADANLPAQDAGHAVTGQGATP
ncbi:MAG: hypothetical protein HZA90_11120 [Verrucomicrobia bacterium]|nr:hypothetical protein [Verrucomicrobiota bacterium]